MTLTRSHKWIIAIVGIIALGIAVYFLIKLISKEQEGGTTPTDTTTTTPGLAELAAGFFGGSWLGGIKDLFGGGGGKKPVKCVDGCDENNYGHDCNGFLDAVNCGAGRVQQ